MMGAWLLADDALDAVRVASRATPSAEQIEAFSRGPAASPLRVEGNTAHVSVVGILTQRPSVMAMLMGGGTTYTALGEALSAAAADPSVHRVEMFVDSPGGQVAGLFELLAQLESYPKPIRVRASLAASAAYAIAAAAGPIEAVGPASSFGSIGVAVRVAVDDGVIDVASSNAPNKRPDARTPEGKAAIRSELDALAELFVDSIAKGRKTTAQNVNKNFGRGGTLLARAALEMNMIDKLGSTTASPHRASAGLGPNQQAAAQLEARLGSANAPGATESQSAFAKRLLAGLQPAPKAKTTRSAADIVADYVLGIRDEPDQHAPECVVAAVIAGLRAGRDERFDGPRRENK